MRPSVVLSLLVVSSAGCGGTEVRNAASHPLLAEDGGSITEPVEVWAHVRTVSADGSLVEQVRTHEDPALVARLSEITAPDFFDLEVDVQIQDIGRGDVEGGATTYETRVVLVPRIVADEAEDEAAFEEIAGMSYQAWRA